jgi:hypothetical protein
VQEEVFEFLCRMFLCGGVRGWPFANPAYFEERGHVTLYRRVCIYAYIYVYVCVCT